MYSSIKPKPCSNCGSPYHSAMYHKPRKPIEIKTVPKRSTKKIANGKVALKWEQVRLQWHEDNPGPHQCHYCGRQLTKRRVTLDHKIPRSRAPELRFELSNIVVACVPCNTAKGSVDHDHYQHNCPDTKKEVTT